jgi:hypothetical protein
MRSPAHIARRQIAIGLVVILTLPIAGSVPALGQQTAPSQPVGGMPPPPTPSHNDVPQTPEGNPPSNVPNAPQAQPESQPPAPVGTAVAPYEKGIGIAASRPAGAVVAPAKQKKTRSFTIKVGLLIGAAAAVGTVVGISLASPSRPH